MNAEKVKKYAINIALNIPLVLLIYFLFFLKITPGHPAHVGLIVSETDAKLKTLEKHIRDDDLLFDDNYQLTRGSMEIDTYGGARVLITAPTDFALKPNPEAWPAEFHLKSGNIRVHIEKYSEFLLTTPSLQIRDNSMPSKYLVSTKQESSETIIEVQEGEIEVTSLIDSQKQLVKAGQTVEFRQGKGTEESPSE